MATEYQPLDLDAQAERENRDQTAVLKELEQEAQDWAWLLSDKRGRRIVWQLISGAGVFRNAFALGDAHTSSFKLGMQNQGQAILAKIMAHDPDAFVRMQKENA